MLVGWLIKIGMISLVFCDRGNRGSPKFNHARRANPNLAVRMFLILSRLLLCSSCDLTSRIYTPVNSHSNPVVPCREYLPTFSPKMWPFFTLCTQIFPTWSIWAMENPPFFPWFFTKEKLGIFHDDPQGYSAAPTRYEDLELGQDQDLRILGASDPPVILKINGWN